LEDVISGRFVPLRLSLLCLKNFVLAAMIVCRQTSVYAYIGKGTVPENDIKELGLNNAVTKVLFATVSRDGYLLNNNIYQAGTIMEERNVF
jgi:hypothetical protein